MRHPWKQGKEKKDRWLTKKKKGKVKHLKCYEDVALDEGFPEDYPDV